MKHGIPYVAALAVVMAGLPARADNDAEKRPPALEGVDIVEHLGYQLPLDTPLVDQNGKQVKLGDMFTDGKPVVLTLVYFDCPMLCNLVLNGMMAGLKNVAVGQGGIGGDGGLHLGKDYRLVTVSFNPADTVKRAAERQRGFLQAIGSLSPSDWSFLTGPESSLRSLAESVGFKYNYDPATKTYAHPAAVFVITPQGKIARYLYGIEFRPRDLRLAIVEASAGKVGTTLDRVLLTCYQWDPSTRKYGWVVPVYFRVGGALILLALVSLLVRLWRRDLAKTKAEQLAAATRNERGAHP